MQLYQSVVVYRYLSILHVMYWNIFTCSRSTEVRITEPHCHWGWCSQYHVGSNESCWWLRVWLHCVSPVYEWVSYWWVCNCQDCMVIFCNSIPWSSCLSPLPTWQLAMTLKVVHTLWPSVLIKRMPPWWCLPLTIWQQSFQSTSRWWLPPLTNQVLLRLVHPTWQLSPSRMMIQVRR